MTLLKGSGESSEKFPDARRQARSAAAACRTASVNGGVRANPKANMGRLRIVGKDHNLLKVTFDVDIGGSFLLKLDYIEKLKS